MTELDKPRDHEARESLVARRARWRCECISVHGRDQMHYHGEERCRLRGDHVQPILARDDWRLPALIYLCQPCARDAFPDRFDPLPVTMALPVPELPDSIKNQFRDMLSHVPISDRRLIKGVTA